MAIDVNRRVENTRQVVFDKDYKKKSGRIIYAKGSTHFIHKDLVKSLKISDYGKVSEVNFKKEVAKAKQAENARKEADRKAANIE